MDSETRKSRGQSLVELTIGIAILSLILLLSVRTAEIYLRHFKHNYLFVTSPKPLVSEIEYGKNLVFFKTAKLKNEFKNSHGSSNWIFIDKMGVFLK